MRLHRLTVSAFGPFSATHTIDFEELNDAGVFLVTGPTGAGKTSILDAVCFGLFGQVPGGRGVKALRSDHADPESRPEVVLDFSVGGRRFVVRRTPEWSRPKRRGSGTTSEKSAASLMETTDGVERLLSSRGQEVGQLLSDLLGMTAGQFQQVAMLPQGEFQTFLRASSQERHDILQQLFRTERFTRIEEWVHEHSRALRERASGGEAAVRRLVDTLADRAAVQAPDSLGAGLLPRSASDGVVLPWAEQLVAEARHRLDGAAQAHTEAAIAAAAAREELAETLRRAELRSRRDHARQVLGTLADDDEEAGRLLALDADDRARRCAPALAVLDDAAAALADARAAQCRAAEAAPPTHDAHTAAHEAAAQLARLHALLPRERELQETQAALAETTQRLGQLAPSVATTLAASEAIPARRRAALEALADAAASARTKPSAEAALRHARTVLTAADRAEGLSRRVTDLEAKARAARDDSADARERMLDVIARRLEGMAAELAGGLRDGEPCQVCGSREHPAPGRSSAEAVDEVTQVAATAEAEALRLVSDAATARVQEARVDLERQREGSGGLTVHDAAGLVSARERELEAAVAAEQTVERAGSALEELDGEAGRLDQRLRDLQAESAGLAATAESLSGVAGRLAAELAAEVTTADSLSEAIALLADRARALEALSESTAARTRAETSVERHESAALDVAHDHGFDDIADARAALLDEATRVALRRAVDDHDRALHEAEVVLADPAVHALGDDPVDVEAARASADETARQETEATRAHQSCQEVFEAVSRLRDDLHLALRDWAPARERSLTADSMSKLVRGMSADNQLQLRLSSYVLATRLDQVVAAANERLMQMREQRYLLERTSEPSRRGVQAGLGLRVVDEWTGESRDPATLSGGESFVVSLALALGLSDVVSGESGGVEIDTLFIDEGFGMLDLDTLDDVMDRLDDLRAGGRTVGVVSHVTELRNRIPTQLHVAKERHGSSVSVTTLVG